jgi:Bifunctional DNA primase/polymerase, N-terminal/Primase C terminal 2 (PriCT-2)
MAKSRPHCLDAALYYADVWDMAVFPANPVTKIPLKAARYSKSGARWGATRDLKEIENDFRRCRDAAVCIPTGAENNFFVVEADTLEGHGVDGIANLRKLIAGREWPETRMAISPTGSEHYYFLHPGQGILIHKSESEIAQGVDVLGEGGMVLAPPSIKPDGRRYEWLNNLKAAAAPQWLIDLVKEKGKRKHSAVDDTTINIDKVIAALDAATNANVSEDQWYRIMAAAWRGSNGDDAAYEAFVRWSARSSKHNIKRTQSRWDAFTDKPPRDIGVGTLYQHADDTAPGWRERLLEESLASLREDYAAAMAAYIKGGDHA